MADSSVDERGRVVIPSDLREEAGLQPGTAVRVEPVAGGVLIRPARSKREVVRALRGIIPKAHRGERIDPRRIKDIWTKNLPR